MCNRHAILVSYNGKRCEQITKQPIYLGVLRRLIYGIFCVRMRNIAFQTYKELGKSHFVVCVMVL